jgi:5-methylcytosine-specific restriction enzyme subunit McrC
VRSVVLTERRTVVRRLRRSDVDDLVRHFRHVVEVTPTLGRGRYRLTARGYVGRFRTANATWQIRPKLPWESIPWLAGLHTSPSGPTVGDADTLADILASRLAELIRERAEAGLLRDYSERQTTEAAVRGRIDLPRQLRDAARAPGLFHLVADEFTPDVVWNRLPKAAACRLLEQPALGPEARAKLTTAADALEGVSAAVPSAAELERLRYDPRTEPYRPLVEFCRHVLGLADQPAGASGASFLINLEHLFQSHVSRLLTPVPGWAIASQPAVVLSGCGKAVPLELRPDLVVHDPQGRPASVWDVKWKALAAAGPHPADVHQILGYAAALGLRNCGLVYPGRRSAVETYTASGSGVSLRVVRLRLVGPLELRERSAARLARLVARVRSCRR